MAAGRPVKLTPDQRTAFIAAWRDPALTTAQVGQRFGISVAATYATGRRLRLPRRAGLRARAGLPKYGPRPYSWQEGWMVKHQTDLEREAEQLARCEAYLAQERKLIPRWVRCEHCGGRADALLGHPRCGVAA
jgi:hypothetical protein